MNRNLLAVLILLLTSPTALAGAWDTGPFDNDDALDFVYELAEYESYRLLWGAFGSCMPRDVDYLESTEGSRAVAAAALVAANLTQDMTSVPEELHDWVSANSWAADVKLVGTAEVCMKRVSNVESSELAQLWAESGLYDEWSATITAILKTLRK